MSISRDGVYVALFIVFVKSSCMAPFISILHAALSKVRSSEAPLFRSRSQRHLFAPIGWLYMKTVYPFTCLQTVTHFSSISDLTRS